MRIHSTLVLMLVLAVSAVTSGAAQADCKTAYAQWQRDNSAVDAAFIRTKNISQRGRTNSETLKQAYAQCTPDAERAWNTQGSLLVQYRDAAQDTIDALRTATASLNAVVAVCSAKEINAASAAEIHARYAKGAADMVQAFNNAQKGVERFNRPWSSAPPCQKTASVQNKGKDENTITVHNRTGYTLNIYPLGRSELGGTSVEAGKTIVLHKKKLIRTDGGYEHFMSTLVAVGGGVWTGSPYTSYQNMQVCAKRDFAREGDEEWIITGGKPKGCGVVGYRQ